MRTLIFLLLSPYILFLGACASKDDNAGRLSQAEAFLWSCPDTVPVLLAQIDPTALSLAEHYRYLLIYTHFQFRKGKTFSSDSLLNELSAYYKDNPNVLSEIYYLSGLYHLDHGNDTLALDKFHSAARHLPPESSVMKSLINSNLGHLYLRQGWFDRSLHHYQASISCNREHKRWDWLATDLYSIYPLLYFTGNPSEKDVRKELISISALCNDSIRQHIYLNLGWVSLEDHHLEEAEHYFREAIRLSSSISDAVKPFIQLARTLDLRGDSVVADSLYHLALDVSDIHEQATIHRLLHERYNNQGKLQEAHSHLNTYLVLNDSIERLREIDKFAEISFKYDLSDMQTRSWKNTSVFLQILFFLVLVSTILIYLLRHEHQLFSERISSRIIRMRRIYAQILVHTREHMHHEHEHISTIKTFYHDIYRHLQGELNRLTVVYRLSYEKEGLTKDDIRSFGLYLRMQKKGFILRGKEDSESYWHWVDLMQDNFASRLFRQYPSLTKVQRNICCLLKSGHSLNEIPYILNIQEDSLRRYLVRIYPIMHVNGRFELLQVLRRL